MKSIAIAVQIIYTKNSEMKKRKHHMNISIGNCWIWAGKVSPKGYGIYQILIDKQWVSHPAHKLLYENLIGPVPKGKVLDHLCRVRQCINPEHLEIVTNAENIRRGISHQARKTHCPKGHIYKGVNLYIDPRGYRQCKTCRICVNQVMRVRWLNKN